MDFLPEVLSPVGNSEMLVAAVRCGATAVYLGAQSFNARRNAANFGDEELKNAIKYCHINGVKVYLTLNIAVADDEFLSAAKLAEKVYGFGIDGIIITDLGLAAYLHRCLPDLPLHASTQMTVHSPSALEYLSRAGFARVVVSREMSREKLREFCKEAKKFGIEVEAFVHGALCMSMSGQCLMSAVLGGRSGNRGLCAGPCRLPFSVENGTGYDLSLKDLSLVEYVREMAEIGVSSLKIEGRMKRPEYVAAATYAVSNAIKGQLDKDILKTLKNVFSRSGFTDGYYTGKIGKDMFGIRTKEDVGVASDTFADLHSLYRKERSSVGVTARVRVAAGEPVRLEFSDEKNIAEVEGAVPQKALNRPCDYEFAKKQLSKLGGTPYFLTELFADISDGLSVSAGEFNDLRRSCVEKLDILRSMPEKINTVDDEYRKPSARQENEHKIYLRFDSVLQIPDSFSADGIILPCDLELPEKDIFKSIEMRAVELPRGMFDEAKIKKLILKFKENGFEYAVCSTVSAMELAKKCGFKIISGFGMNVYNSETAAVLEQNGVCGITVSSELKMSAAAKINAESKGIICYGRQPLMLTANCPIRNGKTCAECGRNSVITDRKAEKFPVLCRLGFSEVLNSRPTYLADKASDLSAFDFLIFHFTVETKDEVLKVLSDYRHGALPSGDFTRGLYYRGVE